VALLLLGYAVAAAGTRRRRRGHRRGANARTAAAIPVVLPYLCIGLATLLGTLWRRHFHLRVRVQVSSTWRCWRHLRVLGRSGSHAEGLAMIFLLPALEAGALTSLLFALFAAAVSAMLVMVHPSCRPCWRARPMPTARLRACSAGAS
jgi:two-component system sensor histidine kinase PilS (NtrC family)